MATTFWKEPRTVAAVRWIVGVALPFGGAYWALVAALHAEWSAGDKSRFGFAVAVALAAAFGVVFVNALGLRRLQFGPAGRSPRVAAAAAFFAGFLTLPSVVCGGFGTIGLFLWGPKTPDDFSYRASGMLAPLLGTAAVTLLGGVGLVADRIATELGAPFQGRPTWRIAGNVAFGLLATTTAYGLTPRIGGDDLHRAAVAATAFGFAVVWTWVAMRYETRRATRPAMSTGVRSRRLLTEALPLAFGAGALWCVIRDMREGPVLAPAAVVAIVGGTLNGALRRRRDRMDRRLTTLGELFVGVAGGLLAAASIWSAGAFIAQNRGLAVPVERVPESVRFVATICLFVAAPTVVMTVAGTSLWLSDAAQSGAPSPAYRRVAVVARWATIPLSALTAAILWPHAASQVVGGVVVAAVFLALAGVASSLGVRAEDGGTPLTTGRPHDPAYSAELPTPDRKA